MFISEAVPVLRTCFNLGKRLMSTGPLFGPDSVHPGDVEAKAAQLWRERSLRGNCNSCGFELKSDCRRIYVEKEEPAHLCSTACVHQVMDEKGLEGSDVGSACPTHGSPVLTTLFLASLARLPLLPWMKLKEGEAKRMGKDLEDYLHCRQIIRRQLHVLENSEDVRRVALAELTPFDGAEVKHEAALKVTEAIGEFFNCEARLMVTQEAIDEDGKVSFDSLPQNSFKAKWGRWISPSESDIKHRVRTRFFVVDGRTYVGSYTYPITRLQD